jgi:DNA-binding NtrC family response regulator
MFHLLPADARSIESAEEKCAAREKAQFDGEGSVALMSNFKIVVVDDEPSITNTLCHILRHAGYSVFAAYEAEGAMMLCRHHSPAMLISDVNMPGISGIELAQQLSREMPACHIILFSGHVDTATLVAAAGERGNRFQCLAKPVRPDDLLARVRTILDAGVPKDGSAA